jgi:hypothetical protein
MSRALSVAAVGVVAVVGVACTARLGDLTLATTKNVMISSFNPSTMHSVSTRGSDCKAMILFIPTGVPNFKNAIDDALQRAGGANFMTDLVMTQKFWTAIVYGETCIIATGNAWTLRVASRDAGTLRNLALERGGSGSEARVDLADGTTLSGAILGFGHDQLVFRPAGDDAVRVIDLNEVRDLQTVARDQ